MAFSIGMSISWLLYVVDDSGDEERLCVVEPYKAKSRRNDQK